MFKSSRYDHRDGSLYSSHTIHEVNIEQLIKMPTITNDSEIIRRIVFDLSKHILYSLTTLGDSYTRQKLRERVDRLELTNHLIDLQLHLFDLGFLLIHQRLEVVNLLWIDQPSLTRKRVQQQSFFNQPSYTVMRCHTIDAGLGA